MSYIGRGIDQIDNIATLDNLSFNGSSTTFNLTQNSVAFVPVSADALQIQIDGVIQSGNYTVSGSTVTFDFTPSGSSVCNGIKHFGVGVLTTVSDGAITEAKLGADAVTTAKINDGAVTSGKIASGVIPTSRPNVNPLMINGDMAVAQRGTSNTNFSNATLVVDRIKGIANGLGSSGSVLTGSQSTDAPTGFEKSFKLEVTSAGGLDSADNRFAIETKFEHQDVSKFFDNNAMTLSFYVKSSLADTFAVGIARNNQNTSSGGNLYIANYTISSANTWQQVVINIPTSSTTTGETANATGVSLEWFMDIKTGGSRTGASLGWNDTTTAVQINSAAADNGFFNATNTWLITGVQLEVGTYTSSTIPPFQHESFGDNLARCQRYYYKILAASGGYFGSGNIDGSNDAQIFVPFSVTMRTSPSAIETNGTASHYAIRTTFNTTCDVVPVFSNTDLDKAMVIFKKSNHGITNASAALGRSQDNTAFLAWSSELWVIQ